MYKYVYWYLRSNLQASRSCNHTYICDGLNAGSDLEWWAQIRTDVHALVCTCPGSLTHSPANRGTRTPVLHPDNMALCIGQPRQIIRWAFKRILAIAFRNEMGCLRIQKALCGFPKMEHACLAQCICLEACMLIPGDFDDYLVWSSVCAFVAAGALVSRSG